MKNVPNFFERYGELPESMVINGEVKDEQTGGALVFGEDSDEEAAAAKQNDEEADNKDWNEVLENL